MEEFTQYIYNIYKLCYKCMKEDLIRNKESKLYEYFISNHHDFWYINEFVKEDIENITSRI